MEERDQVVEVLGYCRDDVSGTFGRRVRYADGSEGVQTGKVSIETYITRADGTVEPGGKITDIRVGGST